MKKIFAILICVMLSFNLVGCGEQEVKENINETTASQEGLAVAIYAGESNVYIDEARYYAYTTQATYETYYLAEKEELNWNSGKTKGTPLQYVVKSTVLDAICRRECMYELADEYNIKLSEKEIKKINIDVENFYEEGNSKLVDKINISEDRLNFVFQKAKIAEKVENIMNTSDKNLADSTYKKWKEEHTVTADKNWEDINYNEPIFTAEDIQ